jgi:hypothetical protein
LQEGDAGRTKERLLLEAACRKRLFLSTFFALLARIGITAIGSRWMRFAAGTLLGGAAWLVRKDRRLSWIVILGCSLAGLAMAIFIRW